LIDSSGSTNIDKSEVLLIPNADVNLFIRESGEEYEIQLISSDIPLQVFGPISFKGKNPESTFQSFFKDIENLKLPANQIDYRIKKKGEDLYDNFFPPALKELY
jgi:hypothetical protein